MNIKILPDIPEKLLTEIYSDLAKPGVQQIGKALGGILSVLNIPTIPFKLLNESGEIWLSANLEKYRLKMSQINASDVTPALPEIAIPIIEKLSYTTCEELVEMYTSLLKNASNNNGVQFAHPSFVSTISMLSKDEALILEDAYQEKLFESIHITQTFQDGRYTTPITIYTRYYSDERLLFPKNDSIYFENLVKLGLMYNSGGKLTRGNYTTLKELFNPILSSLRTADTVNLEITERHFGLTSLGKLFIKSVH